MDLVTLWVKLFDQKWTEFQFLSKPNGALMHGGKSCLSLPDHDQLWHDYFWGETRNKTRWSREEECRAITCARFQSGTPILSKCISASRRISVYKPEKHWCKRYTVKWRNHCVTCKRDWFKKPQITRHTAIWDPSTIAHRSSSRLLAAAHQHACPSSTTEESLEAFVFVHGQNRTRNNNWVEVPPGLIIMTWSTLQILADSKQSK